MLSVLHITHFFTVQHFCICPEAFSAQSLKVLVCFMQGVLLLLRLQSAMAIGDARMSPQGAPAPHHATVATQAL
jgi:hypothetical protein